MFKGFVDTNGVTNILRVFGRDVRFAGRPW